ncbi:molybdenum cofactor guanylyltransferase MobA [Roseospira marina]|uniref:Molybdenum cofactor guanylyltransferase n=1 Tax=Roseospira marina TaxID=140057 RepID=A0A5M6IAB3_9PROT|nr:molybdenum cofactor guanylyltransferase MobA [Roseospira marina]KAA5605092.1 molybdenum cofactor guanylyltransferase MobA [Roseospira marina]MBB4314840.1 molybdopterin-guanine dinucleotide biosynthesis protein A [Roseospira marina]MBB5087840.1 molybdopterin-guanine dinucleotide biosynthesis protein A [Roseospira marina]
MTTTALGILAGGAARRLGGADKALLPLGDGRPVLGHALDRLRPWPGPVVLVASGDPARFAPFDLPVVGDSVAEPEGGRAGPLAGILAVLEWVRDHAPDVEAAVTVPCDGPCLPRDLLARLRAAREVEGATIAMATSGGRVHPVVALWPVALAADLRRAVSQEGLRAVHAWTARYPVAVVDWPVAPVDPFLNINTPEELTRARAWTAAPS